jgi:hypothetical protein
MKSRKLPILLIVLVLFTMACVCSSTPSLLSPTNAPAAAPTAAPQSGSSSGQPNPSGIITQVVMAKNTTGDAKDPVDPTTVFGTNATIHAVVKIKDAPANTAFKAAWYVTDVGGAAKADTLIDSTDLTSDGTRNLDFTLAPTSTWPAGKYRVEISVNGKLDQVVAYTVQ